MDHVILYVYVETPGYGEKLVRFMENRRPDFYVELWTNRNQIENARKNAWILTDVMTGWESRECQFMYLVQEKSEKPNEIPMFQSVEEIYQEVETRLDRREKREKKVPEKVALGGKRFYGFFSPTRGEEREMLLLHRAEELAREYNVLVISFSPWSLLGDLVERMGGERGQATLSRLLLCGEKEAFASRIREHAYSLGNMDFIEPVIHYQDLMDFQGDEVELLCEYLQEQTNYDVIFMEFDGLWDYAFSLFSHVEELLIPIGELPWEECRWQRVLEFARQEGVPDFSEKIREMRVTESMKEQVCKNWVERCEEFEQNSHEKIARRGAWDGARAGAVGFGNKGRNPSPHY